MTIVPKLSSPLTGSPCGRGGMPDLWADRLVADYLRLRSFSKVAAIHGRTRQAVWEVVRRRGGNKYPRNIRESRDWNGRRYYRSGKGGFFRLGTKSRTYLHHDIWRAAHGELPPGHQVVFKNGDKEDCRLENLECLPAETIRARHRTGANQFTAGNAERRIAENMGWITTQARKYHHWYGADLDDLIQQARIAVAESSRTFKKGKGANFLTWASFKIRAHLQRWCKYRHALIHTPDSDRGRAARINVVSIHAPIDDDRELEEILLPQAETVTESADAGDRRALVQRALRRLTARERRILNWRFVDELSLDDIAEKLNLSRARIGQIETGAIRKLRRSRLIRKAT